MIKFSYKMKTAVVLFIVLQFINYGDALDCKYRTGETLCADVDGYNAYQWATCMSKNQIARKTNHVCKSDYCYYQCMLDIYDIESGRVYCNCTCNYFSDDRSKTLLGDWCYKGTESSCNWYSECLVSGVSYACSQTNTARFGGQMCTINSLSNTKFSTEAARWVSTISKCFRSRVQTFVRPWYEYPCEGIKNAYFTCYKSSEPLFRQFVSEDPIQFWYIFWTMKSAYRSSYNDAMHGIANLWSTGWSYTIPNVSMKVIRVTVKHTKSYNDDDAKFVAAVLDKIASLRDWTSKNLMWFAWRYTFVSSAFSSYYYDIDRYNITILLANRAVFDQTYTTSNDQFNISSEGLAVAESVESGSMVFGVKGFSGCAQVIRVWACFDINCKIAEGLNIPPSEDYRKFSFNPWFNGFSFKWR